MRTGRASVASAQLIYLKYVTTLAPLRVGAARENLTSIKEKVLTFMLGIPYIVRVGKLEIYGSENGISN